ncbi:MAG: hypothetical protein WC501_05425 [Candidatus Micrarchaeia archaeon]|jgi:hypothetical protein
MDQKKFLITTPEHDDVTHYCSVWSNEIINLAKEKGLDIINLNKEKANKNNFETRIKSNKPVFIMFNGHGTKNEIYGDKEEILIQEDNNEYLTNCAIVYARSCFSLSSLGKKCCKIGGAKAFIGYFFPFMFVSDPNRCATPIKDTLAEPCLSSSNQIPISLLKGNDVQDSVSKSKNQMDKSILKWKVETTVEAQIVVACLMWNKKALGFEGNPKIIL